MIHPPTCACQEGYYNSGTFEIGCIMCTSPCSMCTADPT